VGAGSLAHLIHDMTGVVQKAVRLFPTLPVGGPDGARGVLDELPAETQHLFTGNVFGFQAFQNLFGDAIEGVQCKLS
jgi:hypothetical protein